MQTIPSLRVSALAMLLGLVLTTGLTASPATYQFYNPLPIIIPDSGTGQPYPSVINVAHVPSIISSVEVTLSGLSHVSPDDLAAVVVDPSGRAIILFDGPGSDAPADNVTWIFSDDAAAPLPNGGPVPSGRYAPGQTQYLSTLVGVTGPYYSTFGRTDLVNGNWKLYVQDFLSGDGGQLSSWSIAITTPIPEPSTNVLVTVGCAAILRLARRATRRHLS